MLWIRKQLCLIVTLYRSILHNHGKPSETGARSECKSRDVLLSLRLKNWALLRNHTTGMGHYGCSNLRCKSLTSWLECPACQLDLKEQSKTSKRVQFFQSGALFLAIRHILELKSVICWNLEVTFLFYAVHRYVHGFSFNCFSPWF